TLWNPPRRLAGHLQERLFHQKQRRQFEFTVATSISRRCRMKLLLSKQRGAALIIVLAFVVLMTGLGVAYLSRTTSDRQVAHSSFNQANVDQLAQSAMDNVIGDLRQEIVNGSSPSPAPTFSANGATNYLYVPTSVSNVL